MRRSNAGDGLYTKVTLAAARGLQKDFSVGRRSGENLFVIPCVKVDAVFLRSVLSGHRTLHHEHSHIEPSTELY